MNCECIKSLQEMGYVKANLLHPGQYVLYEIRRDRVKRSEPLVINYCPLCGTKIKEDGNATS